VAEGLAQLRGLWQKLTLTQRVVMVGVALAVVGVGLYMAHRISQPTMVLLKGNLPLDEAAAIEDKLRESGVAYRMQGTRMYVDEQRKDEAVLMLARENLIGGDRGGYELLDKEKIGAPPSSTAMLQKRAQEGEIEKLLRQIDGVVTARVMIAPGEASVFGNRGRESSASVMVTLDTGVTAGAAMIRTIVNTVSGAVNIPAHRVSVSDSRGQPLAGQSTAAEGSALGGGNNSVLGHGRSSVKVSNVIATTAIVRTTKTPTDIKAPTQEEITTRDRNGNRVPDAAGNIESENEEVIKTTYLVGETVVTEQELPGIVESKSVAVFVDLMPATAKPGEEAVPVTQIQDVEEIVRAAVGIGEMDTVKVVSVSFPRSPDMMLPPELDEVAGGAAYVMELVKQGSLGVLALAAVVTLWLLSRPRRERVVKSAPGPAVAELVSSDGPVPSLPGGAARAALTDATIGLLPGLTEVDLNAERLRAHITKALQDNPEEVKRLFLSWVDSDKELV
jgi:flagellar M-ring protein FliF